MRVRLQNVSQSPRSSFMISHGASEMFAKKEFQLQYPNWITVSRSGLPTASFAAARLLLSTFDYKVPLCCSMSVPNSVVFILFARIERLHQYMGFIYRIKTVLLCYVKSNNSFRAVHFIYGAQHSTFACERVSNISRKLPNLYTR